MNEDDIECATYFFSGILSLSIQTMLLGNENFLINFERIRREKHRENEFGFCGLLSYLYLIYIQQSENSFYGELYVPNLPG